jgi:hypothetical protein
MGGTWRTKSMFDLDFEDNFCSILNSYGIETFTFDIPETSHQHVLEICTKLVTEHNIKNVMGYSYGCLPAIDLSLQNQLDNLILLDPFSGIKIPKKEVEGRLYYKSSDVKEIIDSYTNVPADVKQLYLNSLGDEFDVSSFPKEYSKEHHNYYSDWRTHRKIKCKNLVAFTKSSKPEIHTKFSTLKCKFYDSSHWILLEEGRKPLAEDVKNMLKIPLL